MIIVADKWMFTSAADTERNVQWGQFRSVRARSRGEKSAGTLRVPHAAGSQLQTVETTNDVLRRAEPSRAGESRGGRASRSRLLR